MKKFERINRHLHKNSKNVCDFFYNKKSDYLLEKYPEFFNNKFLNFFLKNDKIIWDKKTKIKKIKFPKIFSITENYDETLGIIKEVAGIRYSSRDMELDFSKCEIIEFTASSLLIVILLNIEDERKINRKNFAIKLHSNRNIKKDLYINGIIEYLDIKRSKRGKLCDFPNEEREKQEHFKTLSLLGGGETTICFSERLINRNMFIPSYMGETINEPIKFINESLKTKGFELTKKGEKNFKEIIGEIIGNSRIHLGNEFNQYFMIGNYYNSEIGKGSLVFFNFGDTIHQTLKKTKSSKIKEIIENLLKTHKNNNSLDTNFTEEALLTLLALQDKISSEYKEEDSRGTGTIKMIRNFFKISNFNSLTNAPKAFVISGRTIIKLDKKFQGMQNNKEVKLTFNKENSLKYKPNNNYVKVNKKFYPGTIILIEFNIDKEWLIKGGKDE